MSYIMNIYTVYILYIYMCFSTAEFEFWTKHLVFFLSQITSVQIFPARELVADKCERERERQRGGGKELFLQCCSTACQTLRAHGYHQTAYVNVAVCVCDCAKKSGREWVRQWNVNEGSEMWTNSFQPDESIQTKTETETQREGHCRRNFRGQTLKFEYKWTRMTQQLSAVCVCVSLAVILTLLTCVCSPPGSITQEEKTKPGGSFLGRVQKIHQQ